MTDRELMQQALDALEQSVSTCFDQYSHHEVMSRPEHFMNRAMKALRERLAQPETPYQIGQRLQRKGLGISDIPTAVDRDDQIGEALRGYEGARLAQPEPDYTKAGFAPPQREWQGLTQDERMSIINKLAGQDWVYVIDAIEAKLREKNT